MKLYKPMVLEKGQRFTLRDGMTTLGTGVITNISPNLSENDKTLLSEGRKGIEKRAKKAAAKA
jgi:elongation factor Tu